MLRVPEGSFLVSLLFYFLDLQSTLCLFPVWVYGCCWCWENAKCSPHCRHNDCPFICICSHHGRICFASSQSAWHLCAQSQPICDASCHIALSASETSSSSPALLCCQKWASISFKCFLLQPALQLLWFLILCFWCTSHEAVVDNQLGHWLLQDSLGDLGVSHFIPIIID